MKTKLKDWPEVYAKLKGMRGLSDDEVIRLSKAMAATPEERWNLNEKKLKELGFWGRGLAGKRDFEKHVKQHGLPTWI